MPIPLNPVKIYQTVKEKGLGRVTRYGLEKAGFSARSGRRIMRHLQIISKPYRFATRKKKKHALFKHTQTTITIPQEKGYLLLPPNSLPGVQEITKYCHDIYLQKKHLTPLYLNKNDYPQVDFFSMDESGILKKHYDLAQIQPLAQFALSEAMLQIASDYLGELPILGDIYLLYTPVNDKTMASQIYHEDGEDYKQCKFFLAIEECQDENGPFTFLPADISKTVEEKIDYYGKRYKKLRSRVPDQEMYQYVNPSQEIKFIGPQGSILFVDTSRCFHFGSRTRGKERIVLEIQYVSRFNFGQPAGQLHTKLKAQDLAQIPDPHKILK